MNKVLVNSTYCIINTIEKDNISDIEYVLKYVGLTEINKQEFVQ